MGICLALFSGKGGTGKSSVAAALAQSFALRGKKTVAVDLNSGLRCLDLLFGIDDRVIFDIGDILSGKDIKDALYNAGNPTLSVIPAAQYAETNLTELTGVIKTLMESFDAVVLDMPSGINSALTDALVSSGAEFAAVVDPDAASLRCASVIGADFPEGGKRPRLIINKFEYDSVKSGIYCNIDDMIDITGMQLLGIIPRTSEVALLNLNRGFKAGGRFQGAAERIALRICGEDCPLPDPKKI